MKKIIKRIISLSLIFMMIIPMLSPLIVNAVDMDKYDTGEIKLYTITFVHNDDSGSQTKIKMCFLNSTIKTELRSVDEVNFLENHKSTC